MQIDRAPLRNQVRRVILQRLLTGDLAGGATIREEALARDVGVSRTPLREALLELERDGIVELRPGRGFFVRPLSATEASQVYPIVWTLEALAVDLSSSRIKAVAGALARANDVFAAARSPHQRVRADVHWHTVLISASDNDRLIATLASLKGIITRYELAFMHDANEVGRSVRAHAAIALQLQRGNIGAARDRLIQHWRDGLSGLLSRISRSDS